MERPWEVQQAVGGMVQVEVAQRGSRHRHTVDRPGHAQKAHSGSLRPHAASRKPSTKQMEEEERCVAPQEQLSDQPDPSDEGVRHRKHCDNCHSRQH